MEAFISESWSFQPTGTLGQCELREECCFSEQEILPCDSSLGLGTTNLARQSCISLALEGTLELARKDSVSECKHENKTWERESAALGFNINRVLL